MPETEEEFAARLFAWDASIAMDATDLFEVRARKDGSTVLFNVGLNDTKRFFKNRDVTTRTNSGQRKRIYHAVDEHARTLADGKIVRVRGHYRGERVFLWKGEHVTITPPELSLAKFSAGVTEMGRESTIPNGMLSDGQAAKKLLSYAEDTSHRVKRSTSSTIDQQEN